jgi:hypothetical protein
MSRNAQVLEVTTYVARGPTLAREGSVIPARRQFTVAGPRRADAFAHAPGR